MSGSIDVFEGKIVVSEGGSTYAPSAKEVFDFKFNKAEIGGLKNQSLNLTDDFLALKFRRKPAAINFNSSINGSEIQICVLANGLALSVREIDIVVDFNYLISADDKFYTVRVEDVELVDQLRMAKSLRDKFSLSSKFMSMGLLENFTESLKTIFFDNRSDQLAIESENIFKHELYDYQRTGVRWLMYCLVNRLGSILADDMGLGKTAQIIALISHAYHQQVLRRSIIVVPNSLLENWRREFEFFNPSIVPYLHFGPTRTGLAETLAEYQVILMPYTVMTSDIEMLVDIDVDLVVFDEASVLKNPDSARSIAAARLNGYSAIAMTGTPVENSLLDLWSITNIVYPGYLGDRNDFKEKYMDVDIGKTLEKDLTRLEASVSQVMMRRMKIDILDELPEKIDIHQPILMKTSERLEYDFIKKSIQSSFDGGTNVLAQISMLQKFTSHPCLIGEGKRGTTSELIAQSSKFERFIELVNEIRIRDEKVLVFANHHAMIDLIKDVALAKFGIEAFFIDGRVEIQERQKVLDSFSAIDGFCLLALNPKTAGMGLNITAANHVIHYSRQWNPALEEQATARAFRNGQPKNVNAYYLYYTDTIEEVIDDRLRLKRTLADNVVSVVEKDETELDFYINNL